MAAKPTKCQVNYCCTVIILLGVMVMVSAQPQYEVQIQFPVNIAYKRSAIRNSLADGTCCEPTETAPNCTTACTYLHITFCFREEQHDANDMNATNCPLGGLTTAHGRNDLYTFTANPGTTTTTTYPGSIQLLFIIEDRALSPFRLIDCVRIDITISIVNREAGVFTARGFGGKNNIIILTISQLRVVCKENYNGSDCGTMVCRPQDDFTGHFNCTPDGSKVCLHGYQNPETNCVEAITTMTPTTNPISIAMETTPTATLPTTTSTPDKSISEVTNDGTMDITPTTVTCNQAPVGMDAVSIAAGVGACLVILLLILIVNIVAVVLFFKSRNRRQTKRQRGVKPVRDDIIMAQNPVYVMKETNTHEQEPVYYETVS